MNKTKEKQAHNQQNSGYQWEHGKGQEQNNDKTKRYKLLCINKLDTKIYYTVQGIQSASYNKFKWSIICKNTESLCYTSETNIIL